MFFLQRSKVVYIFDRTFICYKKNLYKIKKKIPALALTGRFDCLGTYPLPAFIGEVGVAAVVGEAAGAAVLGDVVFMGAEEANAGVVGAARFATVGFTAGAATGVVGVVEVEAEGAGVGVAVAGVVVTAGLEIVEVDKFSTFFSSSSLTSSKASSFGTSGLGS